MAKSKILFCTDLSQYSDAALPLATSLAHERDAELIIVHIVEPFNVYAAGEWYYGPIAPDTDVIRELLEKVKPTDASVTCLHQMVVGDPVKKIVSIAAAEGVDMIVMSSHGRTGLSRVLMGSVAEGVVRHAHCPVVIFKRPALSKSANQ